MFSSKLETFALQAAYVWVAGLFSKWGAQVHVKKTRIFDLNRQLWRHKHWNVKSLTFVRMFKQFCSKF